ncbi:MAG: hypothetical protein U0625_06095 [Phycisphaerales bacterium]
MAVAMAVVAAPASLAAPAHAPAPESVELRGSAGVLEGEVRVLGAAGIELRSRRGGVEATQVIPWSEVRALASAASDPVAQRWLAAGEALWRARTRLARGDAGFAREPLAQAAQAWRGAAPCPDGLFAAAQQAQALLRAGQAAEAVAPAFEALRILRAPGAAVDAATLPPRIADALAMLPPALAPSALTPQEAAAVAAALAAMDFGADAPLRAAAQAYAAVAMAGGAPAAAPAAAPAPGTAPAATDAAASRAEAAQRATLAALEALRDLRSPDAKVRAAGRAALAKARRTMPAWFEPWARFALGQSLGGETEAAVRDRGLALLLSVAAADARDQPWLAARARAEGARLLTQAGNTAGAKRLLADAPAAAPGVGAGATLSTALAPSTAQAAVTRADDAVPRELSDATATFLQQHGLDELLLAHLEAQVETEIDAEARAALVVRLASLLAARLEREDDPAGRDALLARSMKLINRFDQGSEPLRLVVLRSQHRAAQRAAEDRRAGRIDEAAAKAAQQQFERLAKDFAALAARTGHARERTDREVDRSSGTEAETLAARSAREEELARNAQFFRAWALYYAAWLGRELGDATWRDRADRAAEAFAGLIEPGKAAVSPADVSIDLRSNEGFASAILGMALTTSMTQSAGTANDWLALLESPGTHASVKAKLPAWRIASMLDRGDFPGALDELVKEGDGPQGIPMALIAAARAVRQPEAPGAAELLTDAVARLAAAGRLRELSLIDDAGAPAPTGAGAALFAGVRAAAAAQRAQAAGKTQEATEAWGRAADALATAATAPGAPAAVVSGARSLQAWALRGAGRAAEAAEAFLASARAATGDRAGDAMWMAVLAFDEASRRGSGDPMLARADETAATIVQTLPETGAAVRARAWRIVRTATPVLEDIDALLADRVPPELAPAARRAACEGLYRRFRTLTGEDRRAAARRALAAGDNQPMGAGSEGTLELRRRVEMALALDDRVRAAEALEGVEQRAEHDPALAKELEQELHARRAQVAALDGRLEVARAQAQALDAASPWGRVAWQSLLEAVERDPTAGPATRAAVARALVQAQPRPPAAETAMWARANAQLARAKQPLEDGDGCEAACTAALRDAPRSLALLLAQAQLRAARGDGAGAADRARAALALTSAPAAEWFEAKALQIELLAATDAAQARAVLEQVRQLGGGLGEGEVAERLRALDRTLPAMRPTAPAGSGPAGGAPAGTAPAGATGGKGART